MSTVPSGFNWDSGNREKCLKHGISVLEIESVFTRNPSVAPDPKHSSYEDRFIAVGRSAAAGLHSSLSP